MVNIKWLKTVKLWYDKDLQLALDYLNENDDKRNEMLTEISKHEDYDLYGLKYCIDNGYSESFTRFDSDVCEKFIYYFKKLFL